VNVLFVVLVTVLHIHLLVLLIFPFIVLLIFPFARPFAFRIVFSISVYTFTLIWRSCRIPTR
jgi:hypothetical protein